MKQTTDNTLMNNMVRYGVADFGISPKLAKTGLTRCIVSKFSIFDSRTE
ncbi:hypothetical protein HZB94_01920 [Candidatus Falkowbacteria bacterium]|nr:hypothetical protein [Candidatus Falkowbacteria bacterium]